MPFDVETHALRVLGRGPFGAAPKFFDLVVLVCCEPRRPSAGMVDSLLVLLGQKNWELKQQKMRRSTREEEKRTLSIKGSGENEWVFVAWGESWS